MYAKILRLPVHGANSRVWILLREAEDIKVIRMDSLAVLHPHPDVAEKASVQMKVQHDLPDSGVDGRPSLDTC
jgi:hypothetical protein